MIKKLEKKCHKCHGRLNFRDKYGMAFDETSCPLICEHNKNQKLPPEARAPRHRPNEVLAAWEQMILINNFENERNKENENHA